LLTMFGSQPGIASLLADSVDVTILDTILDFHNDIQSLWIRGR